MRQNKRPTIYDLARLAKTSPSTVSSVLNGNWRKRRISEKLARSIKTLAHEQGYALNRQARALRKDRSGIIGMILPMYDNRYFGSIAEHFEQMARDRGLLPVITSTRRDPELEAEAARAMLSYRVEYLVCAGTTAPDQIHDLCAEEDVPSLNLDLPGTKAPSVISDNYTGAYHLTAQIIRDLEDLDVHGELAFVGGRHTDHNTKERLRGFNDASKAKIETRIETCGYAADKAYRAMADLFDQTGTLPSGLFVNSTISLEGVIRFLGDRPDVSRSVVSIGCFDWDPFVQVLAHNIHMVRQNVPQMMECLFQLYDNRERDAALIEIAPILQLATSRN
ncbi:substrate-binding domain-containing protein [Pseudaestuariivita rosea]|uniref:substrate-binding domain-containing protein n=1 Tax=Pseudaestuariivita rosea TaxID=2763263 RepID=UPI001ABB5DB9|nr:substrate-binding domain-containing protein [Pseudaestuariivita rosea]